MNDILHTLNQSPYDHYALQQCLQTFSEGDALVFFGNGVYATLQNQPYATALINKPCYVIESDLLARGLLQQTLLEDIIFIGYEEFVNLCTQYTVVQSWY